MAFLLVIISAIFCVTALAQTPISITHGPGDEVKDSVSQLKAMVTSLQQQVSAIHSTLLTQQTMSIDEICKTITSTLGRCLTITSTLGRCLTITSTLGRCLAKTSTLGRCLTITSTLG